MPILSYSKKRKFVASDEPSEEVNSEGLEAESDEKEDESLSESSDDERTLEEQVADVPFEVLENLRQDGRGLTGVAAKAASRAAKATQFHRENKDRPQEMSSKRAVSRFREVIQVSSKTGKDPRFAEEAGRLDDDVFRKRYSFLYNDVLPEEKRDLQDRLRKVASPRARVELQASLTRVQQQLRQEDLRKRTQKLEEEAKGKERRRVGAGKTPFFLKKSEKKQLQLLAKYQELKERGKLDKFMEKRRKKNASKDHRYLPTGRRELE